MSIIEEIRAAVINTFNNYNVAIDTNDVPEQTRRVFKEFRQMYWWDWSEDILDMSRRRVETEVTDGSRWAHTLRAIGTIPYLLLEDHLRQEGRL